MFKKSSIGLLFITLFLGVFSVQAEDNSFFAKKDVKNFIQEMSEKHHFDKALLSMLFKSFEPNAKILKTISKPYEALPWYRYQAALITEERIQKGVQFWTENEKMLKKAELKYGVPPEIIVAILGVETFYGKKTGNYPVFESLSTLAFSYPPRATFFKSELEQFLLLAQEENLNPKTTLGSYAGAIGAPQFMPSSYRRFAVDFTGKGKRDLINSMEDAIGSIGNYFNQHGWKNGETIALKTSLSETKDASQFANPKNPKPHLTLKALQKLGVNIPNVKNDAQYATLIMLDAGNQTKEPWLGFNNFYVITRYNHSIHYAMAVYQLSQRLRALKG